MIRIPRRQPAFIWIEPSRSTKATISINGEDVTDNVLRSDFTRGIVGEDMGCEILLDNNGDQYTNQFTFGNVIQLKFDFTNGTTVQWEGELEEVKKKIDHDQGLTLLIRGSHYTASLLDVTVVGEFSGALVSDILREIVTDFLPGFTTSNVTDSSVQASITWNNKPFVDCVVDLMKLADFDCYVDNSKDFHFFARESIENDNLAFHEDGGLLELRGLGPDSVDVKNKTVVYGEAGGLPVIATSEDTASQGTYGVKENIIKDTSVTDEDEALDIGAAENAFTKEPPVKGSADTLLYENINPGDFSYVLANNQGINARHRIISYTFFFPDEAMEVNFSKEVTIPKLFKEREQGQLRQESIVNPFNMKHSYNFTFDNESKVDAASSTNIQISNSELSVQTGTPGVMVSNRKETPITVTSVHVKAMGENTSGASYRVSADNGVNWTAVNAETETSISNTGTDLIVEATITNENTKIDALAVLYK